MRKNQKATRYGIALSTLLMSSSLTAAMDAPIPIDATPNIPTEHLSSLEETNLAFLQDSLFIEVLFKKCTEKGYEFIHEVKVDIPVDPASMAEKETMDPLSVFLGCLFSQEHEDKALALLRQNPDWASMKLHTKRFNGTYTIIPEDLQNVSIVHKYERLTPAEEKKMGPRKLKDYEKNMKGRYPAPTQDQLYLEDFAIQFGQLRILELLTSYNKLWFYNTSGSWDKTGSPFFSMMDQYPWELLENPEKYNITYSEIAANDGLTYFIDSLKVEEEDFKPNGRGYQIAIRLKLLGCYRYSDDYWAKRKAKEKGFLTLVNTLDQIDTLHRIKFIPFGGKHPAPEIPQDKSTDYYPNFLELDPSLIRDCLREVDYNPTFAKKAIEVISGYVDTQKDIVQKLIGILTISRDCDYFDHVVKTAKDKTQPQSDEEFSKYYQEKIDAAIKEHVDYKARAHSLIKVYQEIPNPETILINDLKAQLMNMGTYGGDHKFDNRQIGFSTINQFLIAQGDTLDLPNACSLYLLLNGSNKDLFPLSSDKTDMTRIQWSTIHSGTRNHASTPQGFLESINRDIRKS